MAAVPGHLLWMSLRLPAPDARDPGSPVGMFRRRLRSLAVARRLLTEETSRSRSSPLRERPPSFPGVWTRPLVKRRSSLITPRWHAPARGGSVSRKTPDPAHAPVRSLLGRALGGLFLSAALLIPGELSFAPGAAEAATASSAK